MKLVVTCLLHLIMFSNAFSQEVSEESINTIYNNIIDAIGNSFPPPPKLNIIDTERSVAYISNRGIFIERKLINTLFKTQNFESKIAYVMAHELAHHYLNHNWMFNSGLGYTSEIGKFLENNSTDINQRKLSESQADLFAGFFGQIAGYNVLKYGGESLEAIYRSYNIPNEINGYPSYEERIVLLNKKREEAEKLNTFFSIGVAAFELKDYKLANLLFNEILKNNFTSREIYNNIGLSHLMYAISISKDLREFIYPVSIDNQTRLSYKETRSGEFSEDFKQIIDDAINYFNYSIRADENYLPAIQNLYVAKFIKSKNHSEREILLKEIMDLKMLDQKTKVDFQILTMLLNNDSLKKINKLASNGTSISSQNISSKSSEEQLEQMPIEELIKELKIDDTQFLFGFERPYVRLSSNYSDFTMEIKELGTSTLYKIQEKFIIKASINSINEIKLKGTNSIYKKERFIYALFEGF